MTLQAAFDAALGKRQAQDAPPALGVAVSGGSDSLAALLLAQDWVQRHGVRLMAATVDHGLRPAAATEAQTVARLCQERGISHHTLRWDGWDGQGNLQAAARAARYRLLREWAEKQSIHRVLLGHTADDQAETVLLALARGSGIDGLAGMASLKDGLFLRPLLAITRTDLRAYLGAQEITWIDDPSNDDPKFKRVAARKLMDQLATLGVQVDRLRETAAHMARAQVTLRAAASDFVANHVRSEGPDLLFPVECCDPTRDDTCGRVMAQALQWISGGAYKPRFAALTAAADALRGGEKRMLHGVLMTPEGPNIRFSREPAAASEVRNLGAASRDIIWDGRWRVSCALDAGWPAGAEVRALGESIKAVPIWRQTGLPRDTVMATPAIFVQTDLVCAPFIEKDAAFGAQIKVDFASFMIAH